MRATAATHEFEEVEELFNNPWLQNCNRMVDIISSKDISWLRTNVIRHTLPSFLSVLSDKILKVGQIRHFGHYCFLGFCLSVLK
jgi:hypothetical protein